MPRMIAALPALLALAASNQQSTADTTMNAKPSLTNASPARTNP